MQLVVITPKEYQHELRFSSLFLNDVLTRKQRACPAGAKHKLPQDILVKQNKYIDYSAA